MEWNFSFSLYSTPQVVILSLCLFLLTSLPSASTFISDGIFQSQASTGRNLLQTPKPCPIAFEFLNYSVILNQCKGPNYPPKECCGAFTEFACPYADEINDLSNNCATTMFSYINLNGHYPPGLFSRLCQGDKNGLPCPATPPAASANDSGGSRMACNPNLLLMLTGGCLARLFKLF